MPSHALPQQHTPFSAFSLTDSSRSLLPLRYRSELLHFFSFYWNLTLLHLQVPPVNRRIFPSYPAPPPFLSHAIYLAPGSSYPRAPILSSRHSREFSSHQNALSFSSSSSPWIGEPGVGGWGGERARGDCEFNSQGFYSILLTALLSLFFFA